MNILKKLQSATPSSGNKPYHGFGKLAIGCHKILCFRIVKNKFKKDESDGKSLLVELDNEVLFLPQYFLKTINGEDVNELNTCGESMYLYFGGRIENKK